MKPFSFLSTLAIQHAGNPAKLIVINQAIVDHGADKVAVIVYKPHLKYVWRVDKYISYQVGTSHVLLVDTQDSAMTQIINSMVSCYNRMSKLEKTLQDGHDWNSNEQLHYYPKSCELELSNMLNTVRNWKFTSEMELMLHLAKLL